MESEGSKLAPFAIRVFKTPANSVPSERAFSAMNLVESKLRSKITAENMDMATFIFINGKVLPYREELYSRPTNKQIEDKLIELEDALYADMLPNYLGPRREDEVREEED